jgi:hypothetical protein
MCIDYKKVGGGILGYPAALLLICTIDAIGNALLKPVHRKSTRLDVIRKPLFEITLNDSQARSLTAWFRNGLAHSATMARGVELTDQTKGKPFHFDKSGALVGIRVPILYDHVEKVWKKLKSDKSKFNPRETPSAPELSFYRGPMTTYSTPASGTGFLPPYIIK